MLNFPELNAFLNLFNPLFKPFKFNNVLINIYKGDDWGITEHSDAT